MPKVTEEPRAVLGPPDPLLFVGRMPKRTDPCDSTGDEPHEQPISQMRKLRPKHMKRHRDHPGRGEAGLTALPL